jgi:hypothetical protein
VKGLPPRQKQGMDRSKRGPGDNHQGRPEGHGR